MNGWMFIRQKLKHLFQLCDHPKYNHLSQFRCAAKQCFDCLQLKEMEITIQQSAKSKQFNLKCIQELSVIVYDGHDVIPETYFDLLEQRLLLQGG